MIGSTTALLISLAITIILCGGLMYYVYSRLNILESSIIEHGKILQSFIINSHNQNLGNMAKNTTNTTNQILHPDPNQNLGNDKIDISDDEDNDDDEHEDEDEDEDDKIILSKQIDNGSGSDIDPDIDTGSGSESDTHESDDDYSNKKIIKMNTSKVINIEPLDNIKRFTNRELSGGLELLANVEELEVHLLGNVELEVDVVEEMLCNVEEVVVEEINIQYEPSQDFISSNKVLNLDIKDDNEINLDDITDIKELDPDVDEKKGKSKPFNKMNVNDLRELVLAKNLEKGITNNNDDLTKLKKSELLKMLNA